MFKKVFDQKGTWAASEACKKWLTDNGYSYGSTSAMCPMPVLRGDWIIAKWKNLTRAEIAGLDGKVSGDFREGPLTLLLKQAPDAAMAAKEGV
jgi:hypothetical protein